MVSTKTIRICMMFIMTLCFGALNAQTQMADIPDYRQCIGIEDFNLQVTDKNSNEYFVTPQQKGDEMQINSLPNFLSRGSKSYAYFPNNGVQYFDIDDPTNRTSIPNAWSILGSNNLWGARAIDGVMYGYQSDHSFVKIDIVNGILIEKVPPATTGVTTLMLAMAYDYTTGTMYGVDNTTLYTINLETGQRTAAANLSGFNGSNAYPRGLDFNLEGTMYLLPAEMTAGWESLPPNLYTVNKTTGAVISCLGELGTSMGTQQQPMAFDHITGKLYWARYPTGMPGTLEELNLETGAATTVSEWGTQAIGLSIPYNPPTKVMIYGNIHAGSPPYYMCWNVEDIDEYIPLAPALYGIQGSEFYNGTLYGYRTTGSFVKINSQSGAIESEITGAFSSNMADMAYDYSAEIMYGVITNVLYSIDLATGATTQVASITGIPDGSSILALAIDLEGNMYGNSSSAENSGFYKIDKTTGVATLIGNTGLGCQYEQSMAFDHNTGILYWSQANSSGGNFTKINPQTGEATIIAPWFVRVCGLHVPYYTQNVCPSITNLEANINAQTNEVLLTWDAAPGSPLHYEIYKGTLLVGTVTETEYFISSLKPGTYTYAVAAIYSDECIPIRANIIINLDFAGDAVVAHGFNITGVPASSYICFDVTDPSYKKLISPIPMLNGALLYNMDFYDGYLYGFTTVGTYVIAECTTGKIIESFPGRLSWLYDAAFDYTENVLYGIQSNNLYRVDLWSGITTLVAPVTGMSQGGFLFTLAIDLEGNMYGIEGSSSAGYLIKINKTTGVSTRIGSTGIGINYIQSMAFDHARGDLYWAQYSSGGNFMKVNTTTGQATLIAAQANEIVSMHIPYFHEGSCPKVNDLKVEVIKNAIDIPDNVRLTWAVASGSPVNYNIYESYNLIATVTETEYLILNESPGRHVYWVEAIYGDDCVPTRAVVIAELSLKTNNPPQNFNVVQTESCTVSLSWQAPLSDPTKEDENSRTAVTYSVFCNDELIQTIPNYYNFYNYIVQAAGEYNFCVAANHSNGLQSQKICKTISVTCPNINNMTVRNLNVDMAYNTNEAIIEWNAPTQRLWDNRNITISTSGTIGTPIGYWTGDDKQVFAADDFFAKEAWTIDYISFRSYYPMANQEFAKPEKFYVGIFKNDATNNRPGEKIFSNNEIYSFEENRVTVSANITCEYYIYLPQPFKLPETGIYWIAISPVYNANSSQEAYRMYAHFGTAEIGLNFNIKDEWGVVWDHISATQDWVPYFGLITDHTQKSLWFTVENIPNVKYNVYMDGVLTEEEIEETSLTIDGIDISQDHLFCISVVDENGVEGENVCETSTGYICNTVGSSARAEINNNCTESVITWPAAIGANTRLYRIMFEGEVIADNIPNTANDRRYVHKREFENGKTYSWEIFTLCEESYSAPRTVTAIANCSAQICETVGANASAAINDACAKATIKWSVAENAQAYRIMYNGNILADNIQVTEYEHVSDFESGKTYTWEIITICEFGNSEPRTVTATANCVGINKLLYSLVIYPNPASTSVIIEGAEIVKVEIYNMLGYLIDVKKGRINTLDVSTYTQGQYVFKLYDINNNVVNKLITIKK